MRMICHLMFFVSLFLARKERKIVVKNFKDFLKKYHTLLNSFIVLIIQSQLISNMQKHNPNPFLKIKQNPEPTSAETMCPRCQQTGITNILLADIPLFREILLCSFHCEHCGESNNEVQFAGQLPDLGVEVLFRCLKPEDLNRDVIRSEHCTLWFQQLDLELPPKRAQVTNIESLLKRTYEDLNHHQEERQKEDKEQHKKLSAFLEKVMMYADGKHFPLTVKLKDPSGNSNIKNPFAPRTDKQLEISYFRRSLEQLEKMGYSIENAKEEMRLEQERQVEIAGNMLNFVEPFEEEQLMKHEPLSFEVPCEACFEPGLMNTCRTSVPYFADIVIMSFTCDHCGHHTTETKNSGQIGDEALMITLNVEKEEDLKRDLFKSETCFVAIPELDLQLDYGTLGGVFTTVEGLLEKIHDHLSGHNPFIDSDSDDDYSGRMKKFLERILIMGKGEEKFTLQLIDPLARSFLQNPYHPHPDPNARRDLRERTFEENQMLGINDMKVQNYN